MSPTLPEYAMAFAEALSALAAQKRQSDKARKFVCERSRYLRMAIRRADSNGHGRLDASLAKWIDDLFSRATREMARRKDDYYSNVCARYDGKLAIKPILDRAMERSRKSAQSSRRRAVPQG